MVPVSSEAVIWSSGADVYNKWEFKTDFSHRQYQCTCKLSDEKQQNNA